MALQGAVIDALSGQQTAGEAGEEAYKKNYKRSKKAHKRGMEQLGELKGMAQQYAQPGLDVYQQQYGSLFGDAAKAARGMGQMPAMRGQFDLQQQQFTDRMARSGLGQSGIAEAGRSQMNRQQAQQLGNMQLQAQGQQQRALAGLAGQAQMGGMQSAQMAMNPQQQMAQSEFGWRNALLGSAGTAANVASAAVGPTWGQQYDQTQQQMMDFAGDLVNAAIPG